MQSQLESLRKTHGLEKQMVSEQYEEAVRKLEDKVAALKDELHSRERQVAELHMSQQVSHTLACSNSSISKSGIKSQVRGCIRYVESWITLGKWQKLQ